MRLSSGNSVGEIAIKAKYLCRLELPDVHDCSSLGEEMVYIVCPKRWGNEFTSAASASVASTPLPAPAAFISKWGDAGATFSLLAR